MAEPEKATAVAVTIRGRVQGVGFRFRCVGHAEQLGVRGWVRNERDGTVTGHFEGPPDAVAALVDWCRVGPPHARVEAVEERPAEPIGAGTFSVR